jgi:molybdate transport system substrate-binding protein
MLAVRIATVATAILATAPASAAEVNIIAAGAVRGIIGGMIDDYSKQTGLKFNLTVGPTGQLRDAIASGKLADLVIVSAPLMADMEKTGKIAPNSRVDLGQVGLGVVVREGSALPDISTPEAVIAALNAAKTIAYTDPKLGGTSVEQLMTVAERFGIKDAVIRKGVISTGGNDAAAKVAEGKADIAVAPITDIHAKEAKLVGPLPEPIQLWTVYSAAIPTSSANPAAVRAFVAAMTAPAMRDRWVKAGWQPLK